MQLMLGMVLRGIIGVLAGITKPDTRHGGGDARC
jgi:hypothetical protein